MADPSGTFCCIAANHLAFDVVQLTEELERLLADLAAVVGPQLMELAPCMRHATHLGGAHSAPELYWLAARGRQALPARGGGDGPAVVLIHGVGNAGEIWALPAVALAMDHRIVAPTCEAWSWWPGRKGVYDQKTQAAGIRAVLEKIGIDNADISIKSDRSLCFSP